MSERKPPSGTVTFLFTDIEGSTWLLQHLGEAYDRVLHDHHRLLREAWQAHDGYEVSTEGDAFFVTFDDPAKAVGAALAAQVAVSRHDWPPECVLKVRMGIHRGEARVYGNDYIGLAVHQAARIASAAHGGQIIVSEAARVDAPDAGFIDLGPHRLKDLAQAMRLFQVAAPGLDTDFPPPRTLTVMPNNFPVQLTSFVGREDDIAGVREMLETARLVTLVGAGGVGKTRLALQVGAEILGDFSDGAWWVDLSGLTDGALVPSAVADALGVREQPGRPVADTLADHLIPRHLMIVLDNCEHLIDSCAKLTHGLLMSCPNVKVLATSREALNLPGETTWRLRSLFVPEETGELDTLARTEAVRLFVQRARAARPDFDLTDQNVSAVVGICRRLDGLPLAIELAAARTRAISVHDIGRRLDDRFRLLTGGSRAALPRQRTLEAAVAWSYDLLSEPEKLLFDRLSVFTGGCTLEAAERVCASEELEAFEVVDILGGLVDRSLVTVGETEEGATRYRMLETLRQFGRERLIERDEARASRDRHLAWAVEIAPKLPPQTGPHLPAEFAAEVENLRSAVDWSIETGRPASGLRIVGAAWFGAFDERERWFEQLLGAGDSVEPHEYQSGLTHAAGIAFMTGRWDVAVERYRAAADVARKMEDDHRLAMALAYEGICYWTLGEEKSARRVLDEGLAAARRSGIHEAQIRVLLGLSWCETGGDIRRAEELALEVDALSAEHGSDWDKAHAREALGLFYCRKEDYVRAREVFAEALELFPNIMRGCSAHALEAVGAWAAMVGRFELGAELCGAADRIRDETGERPRPWERVVQDRWLPRIVEELDEATLEAARQRGWSTDYSEAMAFAQEALRSD